MIVRIYQPARNAMQSGQSKDGWVLEFPQSERRKVDPLMGWTSSGDMNSQVKLNFPSQEDAVAYATSEGYAYQIERPKPRKHVIRQGGYGDNFKTNRRETWTH